jgi:G:T-mismatch repair DNA endonuclease (very short patch repair protein)
VPKTRTEFWTQKIKRNAARDSVILTVWECETPVSKRAALIKKLSRFLKKK